MDKINKVLAWLKALKKLGIKEKQYELAVPYKGSVGKVVVWG